MERKEIYSWSVLLFLTLAFATGLNLITEQKSFLQSIFLFISCSYIIFFTIFLLLPSINKNFIIRLKQNSVFYPLILSILIIPLVNWFFIDMNVLPLNNLISVYAIWYILPSLIMIFPKIFPKIFPRIFPKIEPLGPLFHIIGAIFLAIGFDNRTTSILVTGFEEVEYAFNALWVSVVIIIIIANQFDEYHYRDYFNWEFNQKKIIFPLMVIVILGIIILPIGLLSGFIQWNPDLKNFGDVIISFFGIWFTIALPEEIIARGVIQHQLLKISRDNLKKYSKYIRFGIILLSSFIFGLSHWNNTSKDLIWVYIGLATVAGVGFGLSWEKYGLFSCMLLHTLIDWLWLFFFKA